MSLTGYTGQVGAQIQPPAANNNINNMLNNAISRLSDMANGTGKLAVFLRGAQPDSPAQGNAKAPIQHEPSLMDRAQAIHQIITVIENNLSDISQVIG